VLQKISDIDYKIQRGRSKSKIVHFNRLKLYVEPQDIAEWPARDLQDEQTRPVLSRGDKRERRGRSPALEQQIAAPSRLSNDVTINSDGKESDEGDGEILHVNQNRNNLNDDILLNHPSDIEDGVESDNEISDNDDLDEDDNLVLRSMRERRQPKYPQDYEAEF